MHDLAGKLAASIDQRFGRTAPIIIVGFSLGGLVVRDYVQNLAALHRVRGVFLISAPNHGTLWANLSPGGGLRDLAIGSPFLRRLNENDDAWKNIPTATYWTPYDLMIVPARSTLWPVGDTVRVACPLHPLMVKNRVVMADIAARIASLRAAGFSPVRPAKQGLVPSRTLGKCSTAFTPPPPPLPLCAATSPSLSNPNMRQ